ncbi:hypothetical protein [Bdellovibrio sp. HCB274]|uniref:hypothetical protein n=1 Tax=Bdellovibrio sp. HCB274 TaxID=3394361 RepID=UPI0039B40ECE
MKNIILLILLTTTWAPLSGAVSRVGGGKINSLSSGFEMDAPESFLNIKATGRDSVRAEGPPTYVMGRGVMTQFIDIGEFRNEFPDFVDYSANDIQSRLERSAWSVVSNSDCILIMKSNDPQITAYIATWGLGKGFVLKGRSLPDVDKAMTGFINSLVLTPGSCAWK